MFYNYILYNDIDNSTYNGFTSDLDRRLRQHNGELVGGAGGTRRHRGSWKILAFVTSPQFTRSTAMSFEWHVRYPTGRKPRPKEFNGPNGRLKGLELVMASDKFKTYEFEVGFRPHTTESVVARLRCQNEVSQGAHSGS